MKALIITFTDISRDPRVNRQVEWLLSMGYSLTTASLGPASQKVNCHYNLHSPAPRPFHNKVMRGLLLLFRRYQKYYWTNELIKELKGLFETDLNEKFDVIVVNDMAPLPIAEKYRRGAKILLDAHEYSPEEFTDRFLWKLLIKNYVLWLLRSYVKSVDAMVTVNSAISEKYANTFHIPPPNVITNAPSYFDLKPTDVDPEKIRLIYHGVAAPSRSIEKVIDLAAHLDSRFEMDMILIPGDEKYINSVKKYAKDDRKIRFIPPVKMKEIVPFTNQYDMGVYLLPPVNFNYLYGLPNKLFEFIQARLAIAIGPSPVMRDVIEKYQCGIVSKDFDPESLARELNSLSKEKIQQMKGNAHIAAKFLNAESNRQVFEKTLNHYATKSCTYRPFSTAFSRLKTFPKE